MRAGFTLNTMADGSPSSNVLLCTQKAIKALEQDVTAEQDNIASMEEQVNFMRADLAGKDDHIAHMEVPGNLMLACTMHEYVSWCPLQTGISRQPYLKDSLRCSKMRQKLGAGVRLSFS